MTELVDSITMNGYWAHEILFAAREDGKLVFTHLELHKVYAQTDAFNVASIGLPKRWGFKIDGRLRQLHDLGGVFHDDLIFRLLAEEYHGRQLSV